MSQINNSETDFKVNNDETELVNRIIKLVEQRSGLKTTEIASYLGEDRDTIKKLLYSSKTLKKILWQSPGYKWYISKFSNNSVQKDEESTANADIKLKNLCRYYLSCLGVESVNGVSSYTSNKFQKEYVELEGIEDTFFNTNEVSNYLLEHKNETLFLGYPIMIARFTSKTGEVFYKQFPVFLFSIEYDAGKINIDKIPSLNIDVIKKYSSNDPQEAVYDQIKLEEELGFDADISEIELDEVVERLQEIRNWNWKEHLDPYHINSNPSLTELIEEGIYNKTLVIGCEKSNYTQGLESELLSLSRLSKEEYEGSALYDWIYGNCGKISDNHSDILEVLSLNSEQHQAVDMGLNQTLTIVTGPPGTGKSQVVTDLLINMAYQGRSVLFSSRNNKAVDVVYERVNSQAPRPVMLRVGGNSYANTLAELVENLLASYSDITSKDNYNSLKNKYEEILRSRTTLINSKSSLIALRNNVDLLEQKICSISENLRISNPSDKDINAIKYTLNEYIGAYNLANKNKQGFWTKLLWNFKKEERFKNLHNIADRLNGLLSPYNEEVSNIFESDDSLKCSSNKIQALINTLNNLNEYKTKLEVLKKAESLESIDRKIFDKEKDLGDLAKKLWKEWLQTQNSDISSKDRQLMTDFLAGIKLANNSLLENDLALSRKIKQLQGYIKKYLPCWSVTSLSVKGRIPLQKSLFDLVVIDEASQCDIASILPLLYRARRAVIIGDPKQLSHISAIPPPQENNLIKKYDIPYSWAYTISSLYNLASGLVSSNQIVHLRDHHRSCSEIIEFSNKEFYDEKLRVATDYSNLKVPSNYSYGIKWINVTGETIRPSSGSCYNIQESQSIVNELKNIVSSDFNGSIGIVTPFRAQVEKIKSLIEKESTILEKYAKNDILVDTVHKFQGDERDIILFSPVVSNGTQRGALNFLSQTGNLFNVAITRARSLLIVAGDIKYCSECEVNYLNDFVKYYSELQHSQNSTETIVEYGQTRDYPYVSNQESVSDWEKLFYTALFDAGIQTIPQYSEDKYKLDLAIIINGKKLDIEVDGEMYHKSWNGELAYRDQLRNQRLYELGWDVKRFWVYRLRDDMKGCIDEIKNWIEKNK